MCVQLGGIIAANIYRNEDKPLYHHGNRVLMGINFLSIFLFLFAKGYYTVKNRIRDRKWNAMTAEVRPIFWPLFLFARRELVCDFQMGVG